MFAGIMAPIGVVHASPQACSPYSSTNNTSSDSNAYARVTTYTCPGGGSSGQGAWEVYNLGTYLASGTIKACGNTYTLSNAHDFQYGIEYYGTGGSCNSDESSPAVNTPGTYTFPIESGATTTNETVWSGVCSNVYTPSPCIASTFDSAP